MEEKTPFSEWFNVHDKNHLAGFGHYIQYGGRWPKHFLPADVEVNDTEIGLVKNNIMHAWIDQHVQPATRGDYRGA